MSGSARLREAACQQNLNKRAKTRLTVLAAVNPQLSASRRSPDNLMRCSRTWLSRRGESPPLVLRRVVAVQVGVHLDFLAVEVLAAEEEEVVGDG